MTDEKIFELAESNGFQDDFGRWNFTDEELLDFVFEIQSAERERAANLVKGMFDKTSLDTWSDIMEAK